MRTLFARIAASNYSHVQYFKDRDTHDEFYGILLRVVRIGVLSFADTVQSLLVDYLCLIDPPLPIGFLEIDVVRGDGIVYAMPGMRDQTRIWEWRLIGATSKS